MTRRLNILTAVAITTAILCSCSQNSKVTYNSLLEIQEALIQSSADSLSPSANAKPIYMAFADSLYVRATTPGVDIQKRLDAQKRATIAMTLANDKFTDNDEMKEEVINALDKVTTSWVINATQAEPLLFKECYIITDEGNDDSIMIDVLFNGEDKRNSDGAILWMPHNAADNICIIFGNLIDGQLDSDPENTTFANIIGVAEEGRMGEGAPMALSLDEEFLPNLKKYDLMFVNYISTSGNNESYVIRLERLHEQMNEAKGIFLY